MSKISEQLAEIALEINAVTLQPRDPFTWASGYRMPIYNDNRLLLSEARFRMLIADGFAELIQSKSLGFDIVAGTATSGIPHATTLADRLAKPLVYVRGKAKGHGLKNRVEGRVEDGQKAILIEDVVSAGGSSLDAAQAVRNSGIQITACLAIFSYGFSKAHKAFEEAGIPLHCLLTFSTLLKVAEDNKFIKTDEVQLLKEWQKAPFEWGEQHGFPKVS